MPRKRKPARLWLRPADKTRSATWVILNGGKQQGTGCAAGDREGAEKKFNEYLSKRFLTEDRLKHRSASEVSVSEVLAAYVAVKKSKVKRKSEFLSRVRALKAYWGNKTLDDISSQTCDEYAKQRTTENQARRELEDLRAACRLAIADNICRHEVIVTLPAKPRGRVRHLERDTMAKLIWVAYRQKHTPRGAKKGVKSSVHVARFLLAALYTGSRSSRVWQASFEKQDGRPWADLESGIFYRKWEGEVVADNKRAPAIRIPARLLAHMRRWYRMGAKYVVEYQGQPADPKKAFRRLVMNVLGDDGVDVVRHTLRHTSATWLMQAGESKYEAAGFLGMSEKMLEDVYGHHNPNHQTGVSNAFTSGRAGRKKTTDKPPEKPRQ
jgi:integrase